MFVYVQACVCVYSMYTCMYVGHFFNMATIQEVTTMKQIMRRAHLSTVMSMCRCSDM